MTEDLRFGCELNDELTYVQFAWNILPDLGYNVMISIRLFVSSLYSIDLNSFEYSN
jgi:hypothetical protein